MGKQESNFKQLQKQLFEVKMSEEKMNTEIQDLFQAHDDLLNFSKPKQRGYNWRENKKSHTLQSYTKKVFSIPKNPNEVNA